LTVYVFIADTAVSVTCAQLLTVMRGKSVEKVAVAQPSVNSDLLSPWRMTKFDPSQIRNLSSRWLGLRPQDDPLCKISCKSVHWGLPGKWVKYNGIFLNFHIPFQWHAFRSARQIFTRDDSDDAASRKGQIFSGTKIPWKIPQSQKLGPKMV